MVHKKEKEIKTEEEIRWICKRAHTVIAQKDNYLEGEEAIKRKPKYKEV